MRTAAIISSTSDTLLLSSPLLICLIVFAFFGDNWKNFMETPEWSFLSAFLFIEALKENQSQKRNSQKEILDGKSGVGIFCMLILVASTVMVLAFANSRGYLSENLKFREIAIVQPILLVAAVTLTLYAKYRARMLEAKVG